MKKIKATLATSHVDRHNEQMSIAALEALVEQAKSVNIPIGIEHDPRIPPSGVIADAELIKLEDEHYAVQGEMHFWDEGVLEFGLKGKDIPRLSFPNNRMVVTYDRNYRSKEHQRVIEELQLLLDADVKEEVKKCLDPISILSIGGAFVVGAIASGFFKKMGADSWDKVKSWLVLLTEKNDNQEKLLSFQFQVSKDNYSVDVEIILTNPDSNDIDYFVNEGLKQLDAELPAMINPNQGLSKIVCEFENKDVKYKFGIIRAGAPVALALKVSEDDA